MKSDYQSLIRAAYEAFNRRDIDSVLDVLSANVAWANGMEGGFVDGHDGVREYWTRQWQQIDPHVEPLAIVALDDGRLDVEVHQVVRDLSGAVLSDRTVHHIFTVDGDLIARMEIAG